ncbi:MULTISPECIES: DUF6207 family protein [unclassified Streptomyces]|uniref:DUF6207 family protein n=1 Tax=Streptomyces sp. LamerLS-31b TaxID=1839765 RepID=UPI001EFCDF69|nr:MULTISPECIES: DUF6207 family protein [unclassified Streptomyces]
MQETVDAATDNSPGRVNPHPGQNPGRTRTRTDRRGPDQAHLPEPGLLVIDVAGFDDDTVLAFQEAIARTWGTSTAERTTRDPGRLRMYIDLRQVLEEASPPVPAPSARRKAWSATTGESGGPA